MASPVNLSSPLFLTAHNLNMQMQSSKCRLRAISASPLVRHFSVTCLRDLFETADNHVVIDFIKDIRFYSLL